MTVTTDQEPKKRSWSLPGRDKNKLSPADEEQPVVKTRNGGSNKRLFWSILSIAIFIILTVLIWIWWDPIQVLVAFITDQEAFGTYLQSFGIWGPVVLFAAQIIQVFFAFIPGHVVLIAAAYVYGFGLGLFFNITFTVVASQMAYLFARWAGRPLVYRLADKDTVEYWERVANQKGVLFFTISFLLPVFPSDAMNFVAGLSGIDSRRFLLANFLGRFPSAIILSLIGAYGLELSNVQWGMIILSYIIFFVVGHFIVNKIRNGVEEEEQKVTKSDQKA
ncbi:MAG: TVP38/TMEM64 family protein [Candidatus Promineifilaceae bacterium]|nr:TVP38/TMEM64 family protein [Candidatus Promineifilaceae bacterium]